jgi:hypothetical protein
VLRSVFYRLRERKLLRVRASHFLGCSEGTFWMAAAYPCEGPAAAADDDGTTVARGRRGRCAEEPDAAAPAWYGIEVAARGVGEVQP